MLQPLVGAYCIACAWLAKCRVNFKNTIVHTTANRGASAKRAGIGILAQRCDKVEADVFGRRRAENARYEKRSCLALKTRSRNGGMRG